MSRFRDADRARRRKPRRSRPRGGGLPSRRRMAAWVSVIAVLTLVAGALYGYIRVRAVWDSIHRFAATDLGKRPPKFTSAMNLLVFGSDSRAGLSLQKQIQLHVGRNLGENNTDSIFIVHLSPGGSRVTVMDIPRDTMVPYYSCPKGHVGKQTWPGQTTDMTSFERINAVFSQGGPSCLWKTVEQQTGIRIDHVLEFGLTGFVKIINDVGGVNVCVPFNVNVPQSGLKLKKGEHHIRGVMAEKFWRTREGIGTGSDTQRIQRDQYLMSQIVKAVLKGGILSSPTKLLKVIGDAAKAMTTDNAFSQNEMLRIAEAFRHVSSKRVQFITAPWQPYPGNANEVEFAQPKARQVFSAIAHDATLPKKSKGKHKTGSGGTPVLDARPSQVNVDVLNGSGTAGLAGQAASALTSRGFHVVGTGDATTAAGAPDYSFTKSVIRYSSSASLPEVNTLKKQLSPVTVTRDASLAPGTIDLILGSSFTGLAPQSSTAASSNKNAKNPSPKQSVSSLAHTDKGITANTACKRDKSAFTGPLSP